MTLNVRTLIACVILGLALGSGSACSRRAAEPPEGGTGSPQGEASAPAARPARTLPIPGGGTTQELTWDTPAGWIAQAPASAMRKAQYRVPGPGGDGECVVFYFGPGQGGDPMANAVRWAGQFTQPDGRPSTEVMQVADLPGTERAVRLVEVTGTYDGGMTMTDAPAQQKPGYMLLGAIAEGTDAPWFFKFTGPEATVRSQREAFVGFLRSLRSAR